MNKILDILLPRFITEEVALRAEGDQMVIVCSMRDVKPGERFDEVITIRSFNLLGHAILPQMVGEPRPWPSDVPGEDLPTLAAQLNLQMERCPFCACMPAIVIANELTEGVAERAEHYGCEGLEVDPHAFCHECGARGPEGFDIIFTAEDYDEAARQAANRWNARAAESWSDLAHRYRIAVTPEYEGQWHADLYGHEAEPIARAEGDTPEQAVLAVVAAYRSGSPAGQNLPQQEGDQ